MTAQELLRKSAERAASAASKLRAVRVGQDYIDEILFEAHSELGVALAHCEDAQRKLKERVARDYEISMRREDELALASPEGESE